MVCPPAVHLNPTKYQDPLAFNPKRWEVCLVFLSFFFQNFTSFSELAASKKFKKVMYLASLASNINKNSSNLDSSLSSLFFYNLVTQKEMTYREWN